MLWRVSCILVTLCVVSSLCQVILRPDERCISDGGNCQNHNECCSKTCLDFSSRCARNNDYYAPVSLDRGSLQTLIDSLFATTERPANYNVPPTNLAERFDGETGPTAAPQEPNVGVGTISQADCKVNGMKCFRDHECCTKRCHGFLHQCVT